MDFLKGINTITRSCDTTDMLSEGCRLSSVASSREQPRQQVQKAKIVNITEDLIDSLERMIEAKSEYFLKQAEKYKEKAKLCLVKGNGYGRGMAEIYVEQYNHQMDLCNCFQCNGLKLISFFSEMLATRTLVLEVENLNDILSNLHTNDFEKTFQSLGEEVERNRAKMKLIDSLQKSDSVNHEGGLTLEELKAELQKEQGEGVVDVDHGRDLVFDRMRMKAMR